MSRKIPPSISSWFWRNKAADVTREATVFTAASGAADVTREATVFTAASGAADVTRKATVFTAASGASPVEVCVANRK